MTKEQFLSLGKFWVSKNKPAIDECKTAIGSSEIHIETIPEFLTMKGALTKLNRQDQASILAEIAIVIKPRLANLMLQHYKLEIDLGDSAVNQAREIISTKS